ncbi:MAG: hypothetical protein K0S08_1558 [Gammaproteobacteria bacterium]|jgi:hypothetical protein|nr:hypothetical protein [Gammaproteobacteria bacterium]
MFFLYFFNGELTGCLQIAWPEAYAVIGSLNKEILMGLDKIVSSDFNAEQMQAFYNQVALEAAGCNFFEVLEALVPHPFLEQQVLDTLRVLWEQSFAIRIEATFAQVAKEAMERYDFLAKEEAISTQQAEEVKQSLQGLIGEAHADLEAYLERYMERIDKDTEDYQRYEIYRRNLKVHIDSFRREIERLNAEELRRSLRRKEEALERFLQRIAVIDEEVYELNLYIAAMREKKGESLRALAYFLRSREATFELTQPDLPRLPLPLRKVFLSESLDDLIKAGCQLQKPDRVAALKDELAALQSETDFSQKETKSKEIQRKMQEAFEEEYGVQVSKVFSKFSPRVSPNHAGEDKKSLLLTSLEQHHAPAALYLLSVGASPLQSDSKGLTPLKVVEKEGYLSVFSAMSARQQLDEKYPHVTEINRLEATKAEVGYTKVNQMMIKKLKQQRVTSPMQGMEQPSQFRQDFHAVLKDFRCLVAGDLQKGKLARFFHDLSKEYIEIMRKEYIYLHDQWLRAYWQTSDQELVQHISGTTFSPLLQTADERYQSIFQRLHQIALCYETQKGYGKHPEAATQPDAMALMQKTLDAQKKLIQNQHRTIEILTEKLSSLSADRYVLPIESIMSSEAGVASPIPGSGALHDMRGDGAVVTFFH